MHMTFSEGFFRVKLGYNTFNEDKDVVKSNGLRYNPDIKLWQTDDSSKAKKVVMAGCTYAKDVSEAMNAANRLRNESLALSSSATSSFEPPCPEGLAFRPFQKAGIEYAIKRRHTLIGDEMGVGKTVQAVGIINCTDVKKVLVICPASLKINWSRELKRWLTKPLSISIIDGKKVDMTCDITIINYDILKKHNIALTSQSYDLLICDESHYCFEYDTPIITDMGMLKIGDIVEKRIPAKALSVNTSNNAISYMPITEYFKSANDLDIVEFLLDNGRVIRCTYNHKIMTEHGYKEAGSIEAGESLRIVRRKVYNKCSKKKILWQSLRSVMEIESSGIKSKIKRSDKVGARSAEREKGSMAFGSNEKEKPYAQSRSQRESIIISQGNEAWTKGSGRKRERINASPGICVGKNGRRVVFGIHGNNQGNGRKGIKITKSLQNRYSEPISNGGYRNRRILSQSAGKKSIRFEKGFYLESVGVESVKIEKRGYNELSGTINTKDKFVYNIEVAGNNNYFANNILVSNCKNPDKTDLIELDENGNKVINPLTGKPKAVINPKTGKAIKVFKTQRVQGVFDIAKNAKRIVFLSGTPVVNRTKELFTTLNLMMPEKFNNFFTFAKRYCGAYQSKWGWDFSGSSNEEELQRIMRENFMIRRLKRDVLTELPPKMRQVIELSPNGSASIVKQESDFYNNNKGARESLSLQAELALLEDNEEEYRRVIDELKEVDGILFSQMSEMRKNTAVAKLPQCIEFIRDYLESVDKIIVFAHHHEVIDGLMAEFGDIAVKIDGRVPTNKRQEPVDRFQNDPKIRVFVGNMTAAGVGITLTAASTVIFCELSWVPGDLSQAEDRCVYGGQLIMTDTGYKKIEEVKIGDMVWTHNGRFDVVTDINSKLERKKARVTIKYNGYGEPLQVTEDHKIFAYCIESKHYSWIPASDIRPGKHCMVFNGGNQINNNDKKSLSLEKKYDNTFKNQWGVTQKNGRMKEIPESIDLNKDILFALGFYMAEGWATIVHDGSKSSSVNICGNATTEQDIVKSVSETIANTFGALNVSYYKNKNNGFSAMICSKNLAYNFAKWFGGNSANIHMPEWVFDLSKRQVEWFLDGYYTGDGYRRKNTQQASTASSLLAFQLLLINSKMGKTGSIRYGKHSKCWNFEYSINDVKTKITNDNGAILFPISSVCFDYPSRGEERVYDLTVREDHSFVVGCSTVHNCHRIGQRDAVNVIHLVFEDSLDCNMAKTLIEKQDIIDGLINRPVTEEMISAEVLPFVRAKDPNFGIQDADMRANILLATRMVAGVCDGAGAIDNMGFNKIDTQVGKSLAGQRSLSPKQAWLARKIIRKYKRQVDSSLYASIFGGDK